MIFPEVALKRAGIFETKSELKIIENEKQKIIFIGMHHVGREEFYNDVANKIDSLQKLNYTVFYEGVTNDKETDSLITVRNFMKLRKLMGILPIEHLDTTKNKINGKIKYRGKYKLVNQLNYSRLKVDSLTSINADISINELITEFEKNNGKIKLDSCDLKIKLTDRNYKCKKVKKNIFKEFKMEYIGDYREKSLAKIITKSNKNKVLVIYGDAHFWGLYIELKALDKSYRLKKYKTISNTL
jgi:hypothetical protein